MRYTQRSFPFFINSCAKAVVLLAIFVCPHIMSLQCFAQAAWQWSVGSSCKMGYFESAPITVDKSGNVYEVGKYSYHFSLDSLVSIFGADSVIDSAGNGLQSIIVSADSNGHYRWALGVQYGDAAFACIKADKFGNVYLIGNSGGYFRLGTKSCNDSNFIVKINNAGDVVWIRSFPQTRFRFRALSIDTSGALYVAGEFSTDTCTLGAVTLTKINTSSFTDVFYARVDSSGSVLWAKNIGGGVSVSVSDITVTDDGIVYLGGTFLADSIRIGSSILKGSITSPMLYVARFSSNSSPVWGKVIQATYSTYFSLNAITTDDKDNLYVTGQYANVFIFAGDTLAVPFNFGNVASMYLVKYDTSGNEKWVRALPHASLLFDGYSVAVDGCMVWVSGGNFGFSGDDRMFLAKYDTVGRFVDTIVLAAGGDDLNAIVTDHQGHLYVGGDYYKPFMIGGDTLTLTDNSQEALFILKYSFGDQPCLFEEIKPIDKVTAGCILFPNPVSSNLNIKSPDGIHDVAIISIMGNVVYTKHLPQNDSEATLDVTNLPPGIYLVKVNGVYAGKFEKE